VESIAKRVDVQVVGKTTSVEAVLGLLELHQPDLFIVEPHLAGGEVDPAVLLRLARERAPEAKTIVLSVNEDEESIEAAFQAGANAYIVKNVHPEDLAAAIRQFFQHSVYLPAAPREPGRLPRRSSSSLLPPGPLTRRELEILQQAGEGYSNAQIAKNLWVTEQTVKFHLSNIYRKLDVANRTEASRWAQLQGLLPTARSA
jgi:DNA-binding NarL/FixJ family response regulator